MAHIEISQNKKGVLQAKIQAYGKDPATGKAKLFTCRIYNEDGLTEAKFKKYIDKVAIDKDAGQNPTAQEQNHRTEATDMAVEQFGHLNTEGSTPSGRGTKAPLRPKSKAERERPEQHDQHQRQSEVVHQQGAFANHPHTE